MCSYAAAGLAIAVISAGTTIYAQQEQSKSQRDILRYNYREKENEATNTRNAGTEAENEHRRKVAALVAQQRAEMGANGVDLDSGSAFDLQQDTAIQGDLDALRIRENYSNASAALDSESYLNMYQADATTRAGNLASVGTALTSASSINRSYVNNGGTYGFGSSSGNLAGTPVDSSWYDSSSSLLS